MADAAGPIAMGLWEARPPEATNWRGGDGERRRNVERNVDPPLDDMVSGMRDHGTSGGGAGRSQVHGKNRLDVKIARGYAGLLSRRRCKAGPGEHPNPYG